MSQLAAFSPLELPRESFSGEALLFSEGAGDSSSAAEDDACASSSPCEPPPPVQTRVGGGVESRTRSFPAASVEPEASAGGGSKPRPGGCAGKGLASCCVPPLLLLLGLWLRWRRPVGRLHPAGAGRVQPQV